MGRVSAKLTVEASKETTVHEVSAPKAENASHQELPVTKRSDSVQAPNQPISPEGAPKRLLRPLRNWMEVVERISRSAPMVASFVRNTRAFTTEDGAVVVQFDNEFGMRMMEQGDSRDRLRSAVSTVLRREVTDKQLLMEVVGKSAAPSVLDEILEASED